MTPWLNDEERAGMDTPQPAAPFDFSPRVTYNLTQV